MNFKNSYTLSRKLEKVLLHVLKLFIPYDCKQFPVSSIALKVVEIPKSCYE